MKKKYSYILLIVLLTFLLILIVYLVFEEKIEAIEKKTAVGATFNMKINLLFQILKKIS